MFNLFGFMKKSGESGQVAKDRLKMVLVNDRVSTQLLDNIKYDIIGVIKNYMDIDEENFSVSVAQVPNKATGTKIPMFYADFPIKKIYKDNELYHT